MSNIQVHIRKSEEFTRFLTLNDFDVEDLGEGVYRVARSDELPVFVNITDNNVYFEVDLGNISEIASKDFYFKLLDMNTEILPVSFGMNSTNADDPHLVLVETRETGDLNDNELLSVFDALELAVDKAEVLLAKYLDK